MPPVVSTRSLPCTLTEAELLERGAKLAQLEREYAAIEERKKADSKVHTDALELRRLLMADLAKQIEAKAEDRDVDVREEDVYPEGTRVTTRLDTGEVLDRRTLTAEERQMELADLSPRADSEIEAAEADSSPFESAGVKPEYEQTAVPPPKRGRKRKSDPIADDKAH